MRERKGGYGGRGGCEGQRFVCGRFPPNIWKRFLFIVRVTGSQHRLPREVGEISILGEIKKPPGQGAGQPALGARGIPRGPCHPQTFPETL